MQLNHVRHEVRVRRRTRRQIELIDVLRGNPRSLDGQTRRLFRVIENVFQTIASGPRCNQS
jgi:hypothetical protein